LTVLHGGPQRQLPAFYDPRSDYSTPTSFADLVVGQFLGQATSDVLAFEAPLDGADRPVTMWTIRGTLGAALGQQAAPQPRCDLTCNAPTSCPAPALLCADAAAFVPWNVGDHDVAIGIDAQGHIATIDADVASSPAQACPAQACLPPPPGLQPREPFVIGTGDQRELYVPFAPQLPNAVGDLRACTPSGNGDGAIVACRELMPEIQADVPDLASWQCDGAQTGALAKSVPAGTSIFVALCHRGPQDVVWSITHDTSGYRATPVAEQDGARFMAFADVTGDQLPDLLLLSVEADTGLPTMHVFPQCEARDLSCTGRPPP
jgi:hypothetical protein